MTILGLLQAAIRAIEEADRLTSEAGHALFGWQGGQAVMALVQLRGAGARLRCLSNIHEPKEAA